MRCRAGTGMRAGKRRFLLAGLCILGFMFGAVFYASRVDASVVGSPHDFISLTGVAPSGTCSACHIPHGAWSSYLWSRNLDAYVTKLDANGGGSYQVNYVHSPTIQCYDCHDSHATGYIDDVPAKTSFNSLYPPQDVAFGGDNPGGTPGYYENTPPYPPFSSTYGANKNLNTTDNTELRKTGGHYLKANRSYSGDFRKGDKLPCRDCHDPHAWGSGANDWQAFMGIPATANSGVPLPPGMTSTQAVGSTYMQSNIRSQTRSDAKSRYLCARCHGYSANSGSYAGEPVTYNNINPLYNSPNPIPRPPDNVSGGGAEIPEHQFTTNDNAAACVSCHKHNSIEAACNTCHSFPGLDNAASAKQMSRGHWPHVGKPGAGGTANSMGFACDVCHINYNHNGSNNFTKPSWWTYVNVQFKSALNPTFSGGGPTYGGQIAYGGTSAAGVGVADNRSGNTTCAGLYCHGDNPERNLVWEGAAKQPKWDNTAGGGNCGDCHKASSTFRQGNHAVHLDNTGANARGPGGIAAFSPAGNCSDGTATGCHTAYGKSPTTTHARGTTTFRVATDISGTQVCNNCHSTVAVTYLDNGAANATTGVAFAKGNWGDNAYRLPCLTCHNNSGQSAGATANTLMAGTGAWAPGIEKYWRSAGHGFSLVSCPTTSGNIDNCSTSDTTTQNVYQKLPVPCSYCHAVASRHFGNTPAIGNAWRLGSSTGFDNASGGLDKFCALQCHGGSDAGTTWTCAKPGVPMDHFWIDGNDLVCPRATSKEPTDTHPTFRDVEISGKTKIPNEMAANYMPLDSDIRQGGSTNFLCVTCHDPHGTGADDGVHWLRAFAGANGTTPVDNVHMLRYEQRGNLCRKCHL